MSGPVSTGPRLIPRSLRGAVHEFSVPGEPKGQPRQRHFARKGKGGKVFSGSYDPGTADGWKAAIQVAAIAAGLKNLMLMGAVRLEMRCFFGRPKSHYRTGKNAHLLRDSAPVWHTSKPDKDNIEKAAKDALTDIGVWRDDSQVCQGAQWKQYAPAGAAPYTVFRIEEVRS